MVKETRLTDLPHLLTLQPRLRRRTLSARMKPIKVRITKITLLRKKILPREVEAFQVEEEEAKNFMEEAEVVKISQRQTGLLSEVEEGEVVKISRKQTLIPSEVEEEEVVKISHRQTGLPSEVEEGEVAMISQRQAGFPSKVEEGEVVKITQKQTRIPNT